MEDHARWRYLLSADGQGASWRLAKLLATNSVILKARSNSIEYYYRSLSEVRVRTRTARTWGGSTETGARAGEGVYRGSRAKGCIGSRPMYPKAQAMTFTKQQG